MNLFVFIFLFFGAFLTISIINVKFQNGKGKYNELYKDSTIVLALGVILFIFFGWTIIDNRLSRNSDTYQSTADGFTIDNYKVVLDVNEDNKVDVREYVGINFYERGHHGIYRFIPVWLEYTNKEGLTESKKAKVSDLRALGDNYTLDTVNGKERIKIGNASTTLPLGIHDYEIGYTYDMGSDTYKGYDEFIFHVFGDFWGTEISNASLEINLPKTVNLEGKIKFFADKYRKNDITSYVDYYVSGNTIYAHVSSRYQLSGSLTIDIELPEGYFVGGTSVYGNKSLIVCIICIITSIAMFILWFKNGKDLDSGVPTVEFYAPDNLDPAEIGYLYKNDTGRRLAVSLIVSLASKGYIKIIDSENKEDHVIMKNPDKEGVIKPAMSENEVIVYNGLFKNSDATQLSTNYDFYKVFDEIAKNVHQKFDDEVNDLTAYKSMVVSSVCFLICVVLLGIAYCSFEDLNPSLNILYLIGALANVGTFILTILMKRKNSTGERIKAKINGFRNYIEVAEKSQIDMFVLKNPNYFYDILPYAYVLGVSKKWINKFENIPMPLNDMGTFDFSNIDSLDNLADSVYVPSSSSSSSGSSGCGGGCSSCGGGCSSCGGGGSW